MAVWSFVRRRLTSPGRNADRHKFLRTRYNFAMCGRYTLRRLDAMLAQLGMSRAHWIDYPIRFNIAPSQTVPVIRQTAAGSEVSELVWGFVPAWAKSVAGLKHKPINARSEVIATNGYFRTAVERRRCLVPADGFYEWHQLDGQRQKQPYFICRKDDAPFAFAGVWERWGRSPAEPLESFAIITTAANSLLSPIHDRMPVIVQPAAFRQWLDETVPFQQLASVVTCREWEDLERYPISTHVNRPANDDPACIKPDQPIADDGLFGSTRAT